MSCQFDDDTFTKTPKPNHEVTVSIGQRGIDCAKKEWTDQTHTGQRLFLDARAQPFDVHDDVRVFRHDQKKPGDPVLLATSFPGLGAWPSRLALPAAAAAGLVSMAMLPVAATARVRTRCHK